LEGGWIVTDASGEKPDTGDDQEAEEVGASTERFEAFVREGEALEGAGGGSNTFRIVTLLGGLIVLGVVVALLLR
jgi:hypothetical protein